LSLFQFEADHDRLFFCGIKKVLLNRVFRDSGNQQKKPYYKSTSRFDSLTGFVGEKLRSAINLTNQQGLVDDSTGLPPPAQGHAR
jgi:hypothetical protein